MSKLPFGKNSHVDIIKPIAVGLNLVENLNLYLEIGISCGTCFNAVAPLAKEAYAVDINKECYDNIKDNKNLIWFNGSSSDFLRKHDPSKRFDLVFIDGDHKHTSSLSDFQMVLPLVNDNGIILLHDTYPPSEEFTTSSYCSDTYKTAEYIKKNYSSHVETVTLPFYFGVSIVRKTYKQLAWKK